MEEGKLYYQDPYERRFQAPFYPEGGGQPFDTGTLGMARVLEVHEKDGNVVHYVDSPLKEGSTVEGEEGVWS